MLQYTRTSILLSSNLFSSFNYLVNLFLVLDTSIGKNTKFFWHNQVFRKNKLFFNTNIFIGSKVNKKKLKTKNRHGRFINENAGSIRTEKS
jgi:hypothetical protein